MEPKKPKQIKRVDKTQRQQITAIYRLWLQTLQNPIVLDEDLTDDLGYKLRIYASIEDVSILRQLCSIFGTCCSIHPWKGFDKDGRVYITLF